MPMVPPVYSTSTFTKNIYSFFIFYYNYEYMYITKRATLTLDSFLVSKPTASLRSMLTEGRSVLGMVESSSGGEDIFEANFLLLDAPRKDVSRSYTRKEKNLAHLGTKKIIS